MQPNEKIIVSEYYAECEEDDFNRGIIGGGSSWTNQECAVHGKFDTIKDALKAVCDRNGFTFDIKGWEINDFDEFERKFVTDIMVDGINCEATKNEIELWKEGEKRLWNCRLTVWLGVQTEARELTEDEISGWNK